MDCSPPGSSVSGISPGRNTGVGCHFLLQGIFPTQESNLSLLSLLYCRWILYCQVNDINLFSLWWKRFLKHWQIWWQHHMAFKNKMVLKSKTCAFKYLPSDKFCKNVSLIRLLTCCSPKGESCGRHLENLLKFLFVRKTLSLNACKTSLTFLGGSAANMLSHDGWDPTDLGTWLSHIVRRSICLTLSTPGRT